MQCRTVDVPELNVRIQGNTIGGLPYFKTRGGITIADLPLHRIERQGVIVTFEGAADRPYLHASRQCSAQRLECELSAPAFRQTGTQRLFGIVSRGADDKSKCRRQIERVQADFALDDVFLTEGHRNAPAHASTRCRAVEIVEDHFAVSQRDMRRQAGVPGAGVGWLEIQQRSEISPADREIEISLALG